MTKPPLLMSPSELSNRLGEPGLSVVDASWYLPAQNRNAKAEFEAAHIPGAVFFDQDAVVDPSSPLPHTLPPADVFGAAAGSLGISETDTIVVYDGLGLFSAPRVRWMFKTFGAKDVRLLDGGFPAWIAEGRPTRTGPADPAPKTFDAQFDASAVATLGEMRGHAERHDIQIADARPAGRFSGAEPEPRPGVRAGHIPGARSLPFGLLGEDGRLKGEAALRAVFTQAGIDPGQPVVTTCGSGVTAAVVNLALEALGNMDSKLYDGSWTEWGSGPENPVETGPAPTLPRNGVTSGEDGRP